MLCCGACAFPRATCLVWKDEGLLFSSLGRVCIALLLELLQRALLKLKVDGVEEVFVVAPYWPMRTCFLLLQSMAAEAPWILRWRGISCHRDCLFTVRGYVTALSSRLGLFRCDRGMVPLASLPAVRTWLRSVKVQHPFAPYGFCMGLWRGAGRDHIAPFYPLHLCGLKHLTLRTVFLRAGKRSRLIALCVMQENTQRMSRRRFSP